MEKIKIQSGGQLERVLNSKNQRKLETLCFNTDDYGKINMWINDDSLTYITIEEAIKLRNQLNEALKKAIEV